MATTEIATATITDDQRMNIKSFDDAVNLLKDMGAVPVSIEEYGTGFSVVEKETLVGVPFLILDATHREGDFGDDGFVSIEAVTKAGDKVVINDGGTGIFQQALTIMAQRAKEGQTIAGVVCTNGLTRSDYWRHKDTNETSTKRPEGKGWEPATTYYLAN